MTTSLSPAGARGLDFSNRSWDCPHRIVEETGSKIRNHRTIHAHATRSKIPESGTRKISRKLQKFSSIRRSGVSSTSRARWERVQGDHGLPQDFGPHPITLHCHMDPGNFLFIFAYGNLSHGRVIRDDDRVRTVAYTGCGDRAFASPPPSRFSGRSFRWENRSFTTTGTTKSLFARYRSDLSFFSKRTLLCSRSSFSRKLVFMTEI